MLFPVRIRTTGVPKCSKRNGLSNGISVSLSSMRGIPIMQSLRIRIIKEMVKRLVVFIRPPCQADAQRQKEMLEESLLAGYKRIKQFILGLDFVRPIRYQSFANVVRPGGCEIDSPCTTLATGNDQGKFSIDAPTNCWSLC